MLVVGVRARVLFFDVVDVIVLYASAAVTVQVVHWLPAVETENLERSVDLPFRTPVDPDPEIPQ